jgi:hypothetical protein
MFYRCTFIGLLYKCKYFLMHGYGIYKFHFNIILSSGLWFSISLFCSRFPVFCKHITASVYLNIVANITGLCSATTTTTTTITTFKVGRSEELQFRNCLNLITPLSTKLKSGNIPLFRHTP